MLPKLFVFQSSLETIRAHHWRHFVDLYAGCEFNCQYCLYRSASDYGSHVRPSAEGEASDFETPGILDIGAATDPYQPIETREGRTRRLLQTLLDREIPTFVLTRGSLVVRDAALLAEMAELGLVEVCFSLITLREGITRSLEPGAPSPRERLVAARELVQNGIPVSFHVAPLIPGMDSDAELVELAEAIFDTGASHIFTAVLGARPAFWPSFVKLLSTLRGQMDSWETFVDAYPEDFVPSGDNADTCDVSHAEPVFRPIRDVAIRRGKPFISENYAAYTTGELSGGIYRWKLPTVYDMAAWIGSQSTPVTFPTFKARYYDQFNPPSELVDLVEKSWNSRSLFLGARVRPSTATDSLAYELSDTPLPFPRHTLVTKRVRHR